MVRTRLGYHPVIIGLAGRVIQDLRARHRVLRSVLPVDIFPLLVQVILEAEVHLHLVNANDST
jgi:hypothetical protein